MRNKYPLPNGTILVDNVVNAWNHTSERNRAAGREWYEANHVIIAALADIHTVTVDQVAGIVAVLSPGLNWDINLLEAEMVLSHRDFAHRAYSANVDKARLILYNGDLTQVRGPKVQAFATLLANPLANVVAVDRWSIRVALNQSIPDREVRRYATPAKSAQFRAAYGEAARLLQLKASHLQAATWLAIREE